MKRGLCHISAFGSTPDEEVAGQQGMTLNHPAGHREMFCSSTFALNPKLLQPQNQHMDLSIYQWINSYYVHLTKLMQAICKVGRTQNKSSCFCSCFCGSLPKTVSIKQGVFSFWSPPGIIILEYVVVVLGIEEDRVLKVRYCAIGLLLWSALKADPGQDDFNIWVLQRVKVQRGNIGWKMWWLSGIFSGLGMTDLTWFSWRDKAAQHAPPQWRWWWWWWRWGRRRTSAIHTSSINTLHYLSLSLSLSLLLDLGKQTHTERIKQAQFTDCRSENFSSKHQSHTTNLIEICFAHQLSHSLKLPRLFFTKKPEKPNCRFSAISLHPLFLPKP